MPLEGFCFVKILATFGIINTTDSLTCTTVPDRSNLTGNALLERKWNVKWSAAGTPKFL